MEGSIYAQSLVNYVAIISELLKLIAMVLAVHGLVFIAVHKEKIGKASAYVFSFILWLTLLYSLAYTIGGIHKLLTS